MDFYNVIEERTSIKKYKKDDLEKDRIARMINAAMMSPSWKNQASYRFIMVKDENKKNIIADSINNKSNEASVSIKEAPITAVVVAEPQASGNVDGKEYYLVDSAIAMEHFVLAASNEGYGTCWIASFDENKIRQALSIPNNFKIVALTPVGIPNEEKVHNPKKNVKDYVFLDTWGTEYTVNAERVLVTH